ncbi:hypothetical protein [Erythrobacter neustonensis]|uniref:Uncharacterized protein n=1 Tax=Erythrobacter neustonensis TaxID=1112 RepID=A0A192D707_9SPHN|nr:hypothetical protein [Erythrobacter neustonensis]ANK13652.1 hypothetical protein A9D12_12660 [Erythrobacter neustonensis]
MIEMTRFDFALLSLAILLLGISFGLLIAGHDQFMPSLLGSLVLSAWFELRGNKHRRENSNG